MANSKMMDEVVHYCTKCKMDLNHRIILVDKGLPKRLLCLTCQTERLYRAASRPTLEGASSPKRAASKKVPKKGELEEGWKTKLNSTRPQNVKPYGMEEIFLLNDRIQHKTFGPGLVVSLMPPDKVQVYFEEGLKTMRCGKSA